MQLNSLVTLFIFTIPILSWGQSTTKPEKLPEDVGYYQFPIRSGNQNFLSGTMGELRTNHFHAGIDIKTQGTEGLEVYAAADGYVSRIKVAAGGYGNALYILHPNGTTSVYAHLKGYNENIAEQVRKTQYQRKSFAVELFPEKNEIQVKKGDVIGYSGNTGSSGGPHLHFEIRDNNQRPLNPLKYQFKEIRDNIAPEVRRIALRTMDKNSRINNQFGRFEFKLLRQGNTYSIPVPITAYGNIGVEILAHDKLNGANNRNGVPCMELSFNEQQAFQQNLQRFKFSETRSILIHTDYQTAKEKGQRFVKMYIDNGNRLPFYETNESKGVLNITSDSTHQVQINLWDIYNNNSQVNFEITGAGPETKFSNPSHQSSKQLNYKLLGNNLMIQGPNDNQEVCAYVYANRMRYQLDPAYRINQSAVFLWPMDRGLPDSLEYGSAELKFDYKAVMPGASAFNYYGDRIKIHAPVNALFDTVFLEYTYSIDTVRKREQFSISKDIYPINKNLTITLKPAHQPINYDQAAVYSLDKRGNPSYVGGNWKGKELEFKTRNFGRFTILSDTLEPEVRALILNQEQLVFRIRDKLSGVKDYKLTIDGQWVLMNYDYKKNLIRSEKLDPDIPFKGNLVLEVTDNAGNIKKYSTNL